MPRSFLVHKINFSLITQDTKLQILTFPLDFYSLVVWCVLHLKGGLEPEVRQLLDERNSFRLTVSVDLPPKRGRDSILELEISLAGFRPARGSSLRNWLRIWFLKPNSFESLGFPQLGFHKGKFRLYSRNTVFCYLTPAVFYIIMNNIANCVWNAPAFKSRS